MRAREPSFDQFCWLRALYERRGLRDREPVISIDEVVRYADALLGDPVLLDRVVERAAR